MFIQLNIRAQHECVQTCVQILILGHVLNRAEKCLQNMYIESDVPRIISNFSQLCLCL